MKRAKLHLWVRSAGLLALLVLTLLPGCGNESRPSRPGTAGLQIHLVFPDKTAAGTAGVTGTTGTTSVRTIRVSAWELPADDAPRVLRDRETTTIAPGVTRFRLELQVPPAALYLLQVEAEGILGLPSNPTGNGLLFLGNENVADVVAGENPPVEITLRRAVPVLEGLVLPTGLSLSWGSVERALGYRLLETLPPPSLPRETFTLRNDTLIVFRPHAKPAAPEQRTYRVRAQLPDSLVSAYSESVGVSVPEPVAPAPIEDLVVVSANTAEIRLEWTATGDDQRAGRAEEYDLRRSGSPIATEDAFAAAVRIGGVPAPLPSGQPEHFTVTGLLPATDYYFAIKAADRVPLWSPRSNTARGTTLPLPPAAPLDLAAEALSETATRLHWTDRATNEALYRIERQSPTDRQFVLADTMNGSFTGTVEYRDHNLTERTSYRYRVRAENAGGSSAWSNEITQRTKVARPRNLAATAVAPDSVVLTWAYPFPDPADGFRLERRTGSARFVEVGRPAPADRTFGDGGLQARTTYAYRLRAVDARDVSDPSDSVEVTTPDLPPACQVEFTTLDFDMVFVDSSLDRAFMITNAGGGTLTGRLATTCPAFSIVLGEGEFSLGAGESWQVIVRFSPVSPGAARCTITPGSDCDRVVCTGVGEALPACTVDPPAVEFGNAPVGSSVDSTFTISNTGGGVLYGSVAASCPAFSVVSGGGDFALRAGQAQEVTIRFSPTSPGEAQCTVTPTGGCSSVICSGTGEALPLCSVDPASLDFGTVPVGTDSVRTLTITNIGGGTLSGSVGTDCSDYSIDAGGGSFHLGARKSRVVTVRFTPTSEQPPECMLYIGAPGCSSVSCTGVGEAHPICSLDQADLAFGVVPVGTSVDRSFSITNTGGGKLAGSVGTTCTGFAVVSGGGAFSLGTGASLVVTVRFTPPSPLPFSCSVTIESSGDIGCPDLLCTGTGQGPVCSVNLTSLYFGTIEVGASVSRTFTITNAGGGHLQGSAYATCSHFTLGTGGEPFNLAAGEVRSVTVIYTPTIPGIHTCRIELGCPDGVSCGGAATDPNDHWWAGFSKNAPNSPVSTLAVHGSNLAVGGQFTVVGSSPTGFLAWWTGSSWITSGDLTWTRVHLLHEWQGSIGQGSLVAAGYASDYGGITVAERLFDGPDPYWYFLGAQFQGGAVKVLADWQDNLYAGGSFSAGPRLSFWDGAAWVEADQGLSGFSVNDLEAFGGTLYAAGSFAMPSSAGSGAIFWLNGSSWSVLTNSLNGSPLTSVQKLATHAGALYAIVEVGAGSSVVRLKGTTLTSVGDADDGIVNDIASDGTRLYAVGTFARLGGVVATRVAAWDGSSWHPLGSGISGVSGYPAYPTVILPFNGSIYVGGDFATAGNKNSPNIARWIP
jgi:hypothetical protein